MDVLRYICVFMLLFLVVFCSFGAVRAEDQLWGLRGKPFTDPAETTQMPDSWESKDITYEEWAKEADLAVTLDQHLYPVLSSLINEYAASRNLNIAVKEGTCGISAGMLIRKAVDMAGFCCPPGKADRLPGLVYHTVGIAPLALVVHPENLIDDITMEQARMIFHGDIYNWSQLNTTSGRKGPDLRIHPVGRLHCKARPGHWRLLLDNEDLFSPGLKEVGSINDMVVAVAEDRAAIGHLATWNIHVYGDKWQVKPLKIDGVSPYDADALLKGKYTIYRAYNITTWSFEGEKKNLADDLIRYLNENAGRTDPRLGLIPSSRLRESGWKFKADELVGEPM